MTAHPQLQIDCVEISGGMVAEMRNRVGSSKIVQVIHDDALRFDFPQRHYDIVFAHFFLDCFETVHVGRLVARVSQTLKRDAVWVISEFRQAQGGWRKYYAAASPGFMYLFFRFTTGLRTRRLPDYETSMIAAGFRKCEERVSMARLIASEHWRR